MSAFLLANGLAEALRKPYHRGDLEVSMRYLLRRTSIGKFRVILKRNYDTACWVPPAGSRESHSIYYGDLMVQRVVEFFVKTKNIETKPMADIQAEAIEEFQKKLDEKAKRVGRAAGTYKAEKLIRKSDIFDHYLKVVHKSCSHYDWLELIELIVRAVVSYGRHERAHARLTLQDLKAWNATLAKYKIPFRLWNLFEDARIESDDRKVLGGSFEWIELEDMASIEANPLSLFMRCIQLEEAPDTEALEHEDDVIANMAEEVDEFYREAIEAPTSEHLLVTMKNFIERYPEFFNEPDASASKSASGEAEEGSSADSMEADASEGSDTPSSDSGEDRRADQASDLAPAAEAAEKGDEFFSEFEKDSEVIGGTDEEGKKAEEQAAGGAASAGSKGSGPMKAEAGSVAPLESGGEATPAMFLAKHPGKISDKYRVRVDNLVEKMMVLFKSYQTKVVTEAPGRRMSPRHLARNELRFYRPALRGGKQQRNYVIVYDCSGSMQGQPDIEGKLFLLALNELSRRGFLVGSLILSGWVGGRPGWLRYSFPMNDEFILRIEPSHSAEGLDAALADNISILQSADDTFVYTDANITDSPLDREALAARKVWPVGLYVGSEEIARDEMDLHFPHSIIKDTVEKMVDVILHRKKR